ncbi:right-handed parallel beta-helix repeat-containing protein [Aquimarina algicola]|uniref:Right handed beta helix domain-containing protein n=1 Tax=Aquimarina algicola TaxID=2589995 RepID=A0A504JRV8_9FLAO|nr:right-handed parallel beta-helix repeat-containing protein [Aquimarina algicola]TPN89120.1 hypothetical protein FHK87_02545 [Aquimarina algicola]
MKKLLSYVVICMALTAISCSSENVDDLIPDSVDGENSGDTSDEPVIPDTPPNVITTPCAIDITKIAANSTVILDCVLDLKGETVTLPANVKFEFEGGDIVGDGKLVFNGGSIAGELLSSQLEIEGNVELIDPVFNFFPVRWGIIEGKTTQPNAFQNHKVIQSVVDLVKGLGATTFGVNRMDAYFDTDDIFVNTVRLPSNFHFKMTDNTKMRVFPVDKRFSTRMFMIQEEENVTISGGFVIGDRNERGSTPASSGTMINITSGKDILIENVHISNSAVSGLTVNSAQFASEPDYDPSTRVIIRGCTFDTNRRNNLSVTDGYDILIEDCKVYRAGIDTPTSQGSSPKAGIDVEPDQGQKVDKVVVRNNIEEEGAGASFIASGGNDITFIGNTMQRPMAYNIASNVKIINNTITAGGIDAGIKNDVARRLNKGNIISGNTITNPGGVGIKAYNQDIKIFDNKIMNCGVGILLNALKNAEIYNNTITSDNDDSFGINAQDYVDDVTIRNNTITVKGRSMYLDIVNARDTHSSYRFSIVENTYDTGKFGLVAGTSGVTFDNNTFSNGIRFDASQNVVFKNNTIKNKTPFTIHISNSAKSKNITITGNDIENTDPDGRGNAILGSSTAGTASQETNILIRDNDFKVRGFNNGINMKGFNRVTVENNRSRSEDRPFIFFRGNNSTFANNTTLEGVTTNDIEGTNNTIR